MIGRPQPRGREKISYEESRHTTLRQRHASRTLGSAPAHRRCEPLDKMKRFKGSEAFEIKVPNDWIDWIEKDSNVYCFKNNKVEGSGVMQVSSYTSKVKTFKKEDWLDDYPDGEIIHLGSYEGIKFERVDEEFRLFNWLIGDRGTIIYLTYTVVEDELSKGELAVVEDIIKSIKIK